MDVENEATVDSFGENIAALLQKAALNMRNAFDRASVQIEGGVEKNLPIDHSGSLQR